MLKCTKDSLLPLYLKRFSNNDSFSVEMNSRALEQAQNFNLVILLNRPITTDLFDFHGLKVV